MGGGGERCFYFMQNRMPRSQNLTKFLELGLCPTIPEVQDSPCAPEMDQCVRDSPRHMEVAEGVLSQGYSELKMRCGWAVWWPSSGAGGRWGKDMEAKHTFAWAGKTLLTNTVVKSCCSQK